MKHLAVGLFVVAACVIPTMDSLSQESNREESIASFENGSKSVVLTWRSPKKILPDHESGSNSFEPQMSTNTQRANSVVLKWRSMRQTKSPLGEPQKREPKIDKSIDAGMLLDGYERNLRNVR